MNRKLTSLLGVVVLAGVYACADGPDVNSLTPPSSIRRDEAPTPGTLNVVIHDDPNRTQVQGTFTFPTTVTGGSGTYTYHWYWRGCNVNYNEEWCPPSFFESSQTGSSFTYNIQAADTRVDFLVEVQEVSSAAAPASGKGTLWSAGPMFGFEPSTGSTQFCGPLLFYPLARRNANNTGWEDYQRDPCSGVVTPL